MSDGPPQKKTKLNEAQSFSFSASCHDEDSHSYVMDKFGSNWEDGAATYDQKPSNTQESGSLSIQKHVQSLVHACQCHDVNCQQPSCLKMKNVVEHSKSCEGKTSGGCIMCRRLGALCYYHSKKCEENNCPVPFCEDNKREVTEWYNMSIEPVKQDQSSKSTDSLDEIEDKPIEVQQRPKVKLKSVDSNSSAKDTPRKFFLSSSDDNAVSRDSAVIDEGKNSVKPWHVSISNHLRDHLVHRIVQGMLPTTDIVALEDGPLGDLVSYASKVEGNIFETADSREEYYQLIEQKINEMQDKHEIKWPVRKKKKRSYLANDSPVHNPSAVTVEPSLRSTNPEPAPISVPTSSIECNTSANPTLPGNESAVLIALIVLILISSFKMEA